MGRTDRDYRIGARDYMSGLVWSDGHLNWLFFGIVVFSMLSLLVTDLVWRLVTVRVWVLLSVAASAWAVGVVIISLIF